MNQFNESAQTSNTHPKGKVRFFCAHAIQLPDILTRTRDELTAIEIRSPHKQIRHDMAILVQETLI